MKITFYGGSKNVTGSNYLLEADGKKILIDCGMFQGDEESAKQNYKDWPYDPKEIDFVLLTHSHIDHIGRVPKLYRDGFRGTYYCTKPVVDFSEIFLTDSVKIMGYESKDVLFDQSDVDGSLGLFKGVDYHKKIKLSDNIEIEFFDAGHILGSAFIKMRIMKEEGKGVTTIVFSGDIGNYPVPILKKLEDLKDVDYLLVESAYGNRIHEDAERRKDMLEDVIEDVYSSKGTLMIPAFSMERTQEILYELNDLFEHHRVPSLEVFVDSPLAIKATKIYRKYENLYNKEAIALIDSGDDLFNFPGLKLTLLSGDSKMINRVKPPKIVIAGSGMSTGGRILFHEQRYLSGPENYILFIGYQVDGTLGRKILDGEKSVNIFNKKIDIKCNRVAIGGYSAHADKPRIMKWISPVKQSVKKVFIVQGEEEQSNGLKYALRDEYGIDAVVPNYGDSFELE